MRDIPQTTQELKQKLLRYIKKLYGEDSCWEWQGCRHHTGYGVIQYKNKQHRTHRLMYQLFVEEVPNGLLVCHKCDNPPCCNPRHLFVGSYRDNLMDAFKKGRIKTGDESSSRIHRDSFPSGDKHWMRLYPEKVPRGDKSPRAKLSSSNVLELRRLRSEGVKITDLARKFGVSDTHVKYIIYRKSWTHI
jgi:hypothetical protein